MCHSGAMDKAHLRPAGPDSDDGPSPFEPIGITLHASAQRVAIDWADGHHSVLPYGYLRGFCPCAACQGHGGDLAFVPPPDGLVLSDVLEVGHYALNLVWEDGHRTGIYAMTYLRGMCPCGACRRRLGAQHVTCRLDDAGRAHFGIDE